MLENDQRLMLNWKLQCGLPFSGNSALIAGYFPAAVLIEPAPTHPGKSMLKVKKVKSTSFLPSWQGGTADFRGVTFLFQRNFISVITFILEKGQCLLFNAESFVICRAHSYLRTDFQNRRIVRKGL